ncbi:hypothetical protein ACFX2F_007217 [Malus domestica]
MKLNHQQLDGNSTDFMGSSFKFILLGARRRMLSSIAFATADMELPTKEVSNEDLDMITGGFDLSDKKKR